MVTYCKDSWEPPHVIQRLKHHILYFQPILWTVLSSQMTFQKSFSSMHYWHLFPRSSASMKSLFWREFNFHVVTVSLLSFSFLAWQMLWWCKTSQFSLNQGHCHHEFTWLWSKWICFCKHSVSKFLQIYSCKTASSHHECLSCKESM